MVRLASMPVGGYRTSGISSVGVSTSCVPGGSTIFFSCVIHRKRFCLPLLWDASSFTTESAVSAEIAASAASAERSGGSNIVSDDASSNSFAV